MITAEKRTTDEQGTMADHSAQARGEKVKTHICASQSTKLKTTIRILLLRFLLVGFLFMFIIFVILHPLLCSKPYIKNGYGPPQSPYVKWKKLDLLDEYKFKAQFTRLCVNQSCVTGVTHRVSHLTQLFRV